MKIEEQGGSLLITPESDSDAMALHDLQELLTEKYKYQMIKTTSHEPAVAVHAVFSQATPGAFGTGFLRRLLGKPNEGKP
jgi:hypothetical protein